MPQVQRHRLMPPEERDKWDRWRQRGRRRFLLMIGGVYTACLLLLTVIFAFVPDFGMTYSLMLLVNGLLFAIPITVIFGNLIWSDRESCYEASRDFFPTEAEQSQIESGIRANLLILVPLALGCLSFFLPQPYTLLSMVWFCSTPFFMIGITLKTGTWWYSRRRPLPISHPGAIAGMIGCGVLGIVGEAFWLWIFWRMCG